MRTRFRGRVRSVAQTPALRVLALVLVALAGGCAREPVVRIDSFSLTRAEFDELSGWSQDNQVEALGAFVRSCQAYRRAGPERGQKPEAVGGRVGDWLPVCREAEARLAAGESDGAARAFFRERFVAWLATDNGEPEGLFTGYYIPELRAALRPDEEFRYPIYLQPPEMTGPSAQRGTFSRAEIEAGALAGRRLELAWADDPVDVFFLHIQGSGRLALPDGRVVGVGYAGGNGHGYVAIGAELVRRGALTPEQVSMQSIRDWLKAHPDQANEVMNLNPSYVFFKPLPGSDIPGAQGVALTAGRSLAVDRRYVPLGAPVWIETEPPLPGTPPLRRLMVAQDTGGAIKGGVRADVFWGFGAAAAVPAGHMKSRGRFVLLLPRGLPPGGPAPGS